MAQQVFPLLFLNLLISLHVVSWRLGVRERRSQLIGRVNCLGDGDWWIHVSWDVGRQLL